MAATLLRTPSASTGPVNAFTDPSLSNVSIGTLPGNDAVTVSWQATVDPQSDQLIVNPTYTGSVTGSDFTTATADGTVPLDMLSLEGEIFNDANGDGTLDGVDAGISGVSLSVFVQGSSTALESITTNGSGVYDFTGLAAGNYYVQINTLPSGYGNSSPVRDTNPNDYAGGKNYGLAASGGVIDTNAITIAYDQPEPSSNGSTYPGDDTTSTLDIGLVQAPQIGGTGITVQYYQGGAAKPLDSNLTLTDSVNVSGATVTIGNFLSGDTLNFATQNSISEQSYTGGVLTLTGNATAAQYQTALDSITYSFSGDPTNAGADTTRTITWSVSDTNSQTSVGGSTSTLDVYMTPVLAGIVSPTPTVTATSGAVAANFSLTITDDNTIGTTPVATVTITSGSQAGDELIIPDGDLTTGKITGTTITVSNNDTTALTLTGTSTTTDAQFQSALRDVEFDATSPHSGTRQLTWLLNDDAGNNPNDSNSFMTNVDATFGPELTGGQNFGETEGTSTGPLQLVTFTDSEITSPTIGNFTAAIDWGDGTALDTTGTIVSKGGGVFAVDSAGHTYAEAQAAPYQITVTVTDTDSVAGTATDNAQVADAALTGSSAASLSGIEGASAALSNATFTDANPGDHTGDFTATINWGDGGPSSSGTVSYSAGVYSVAGSHTYAEEGSDNIAVTVTDDGGSNTTITGAASITDAALTGSSAASLSGIEGASAALSNATFTDANPGDHTGDFTATINWGDGGPSSPGTISYSAGVYSVAGSHTYAEEGSDNVTVTVTDDGGSNTTITGAASITDAALTGSSAASLSGIEGASAALSNATFTDANPGDHTGDFTATINWGDGGPSSSGTVSYSAGVYSVAGSHTYAEEGSDNIAVTVTDDGGSNTTITGAASITDAALTGSSAASSSGIEGASAALSNATFTDANPGDHTGDFTATINWGDGGPSSSGTVSYSAGVYSVAGSHTYAEEGSDNIAVTVTDDGGSNTTITGAASITDAALTGSSAASLSGIEGASAALSNATFTDANPGDHTGDFTATINWGDGGPSSPGTISYSGGVYSVAGSHTYAEEGSDNVTVTVADDGGSNTTITGTASITDAALTGSSAASLSGIEGASAALSNATFTDANPGDHTGDFTATIDWGDGGQSSPGTVSYSGGVYSVAGSHTYAEEGSDNITVTVTDDGGSSTTITGTASITDAALTGSGVTENGTQDVSLTAPVATFTDANPNGSLSDFTATVTWGDGTAATSATITESGGVFTVAGTHTYAIQGTYMPTVTIVDDGGSTATVTDTFDIVHAPPTVTAGGTATYIGAEAVTLDAGVTVSDPDSGGDLAGATVTISTGFIAGDTLDIGGQTSGTITDTGGTINYAFTGSTLSLSGSDTLADYQAALDAVTYSFSPSNGDATNGGTDTSRTISWTVNDGAPSNGTGTAASTLLVPTTPVVTAVAASVNASASESFTAAQLFSASDAAGAPILTYQVEDESTGSSQGFWVLNGAVLPNGQITTLTAAQLSELSFVAGSASTPVSDTLEVAASDASGLGGFTTFTVTAAAHAPTTAPTVTAANELQAPNLALAGSSLFSGTAFGGNTITSYEVEDITTDSGHWVFNGTVEPTNQVIDVTVAQLAQLSFDTGYGSDTLMVRANDGTQWGGFTTFTVTPPPNAAPPAGSADTLMMLRNSDGAYEFYDIGHNTILLDGPLGQINPALQVAGVGGFNGSDTADLLMRDPTTGAFTLYDVSNNNITGNVALGQVGLEWTVAGFGDFSGHAGETDMLMRNSKYRRIRGLRHRQQRHHVCGADGPGRSGMVDRGLRRFLDPRQRDRHADAQLEYRRIRGLRHHQQYDHVVRPDGPGRAGMDDRGLWRFLRPRQRDRHADAQLEYRRVRGLRHQQQHHHVVRPHGPGRSGMDDCGLWRFLRQRQRNRHADAQLEYRRIRTLRHQQQYDHADDRPWARSAWNGRSAAYRPLRRARRPARNSVASPPIRRTPRRQRDRPAHAGDGVVRAERWCGRDILAARAVITSCGNAQPFRSSKSDAFGDGLSARAED